MEKKSPEPIDQVHDGIRWTAAYFSAFVLPGNNVRPSEPESVEKLLFKTKKKTNNGFFLSTMKQLYITGSYEFNYAVP